MLWAHVCPFGIFGPVHFGAKTTTRHTQWRTHLLQTLPAILCPSVPVDGIEKEAVKLMVVEMVMQVRFSAYNRPTSMVAWPATFGFPGFLHAFLTSGATQSGPSTDKAPTVYITTATLASTSSRVAVSPIADGKSASGVTVVLDEAKTPVVVTVEPPKPPNRQTVPKTGAPAVEIVPKPATVKLAPAGLAPKPAPAPGAARSSAARVVTQPTSSPVKTSAVVMPTASSQSSKEAHGGPTPETAPSRVVSAPPPPRPTLAPGRHIVPSAVTTATGGRAHSRYSQDVDVAYTLLDWASSDEAAALYEEVKHNAGTVSSVVRGLPAEPHTFGFSVSYNSRVVVDLW
jgi:hypothetical protein